jgi:hypothetical protein
MSNVDGLLPKSIFRLTHSELMGVMVPFLKCLVGGLRHFMALGNGGPPGPALNSIGNKKITYRIERWEQGGGRHHPSVMP